MESYGFRKDANGNPLIEDCQTNSFFIYYTSPEAWTLFRAIYNNNFGMQDKYVAYWEFVANKLSQNQFVVGFDPFNEPLPAWGSIGGIVDMLWPGNYDKKELAPLYERIFAKYKKADDRNIMMFEPGQFPDELPFGNRGIVNHLGFTTPPGGEIGSSKHVLNDHHYCCQLSPAMCAENGEPKEGSAETCYNWAKLRIGTRNEDAKRLGIPFILSEFGACMDSEVCAREINQIAEISDMNLNGWAYWQFKTYKDLTTSAGDRSEGFYNLDGTIETMKVKALARTYVQSAQGKIVGMKFNTTTAEFTAEIKIDTSINAPTEIHALIGNSTVAWYPNGVEVNF